MTELKKFTVNADISFRTSIEFDSYSEEDAKDSARDYFKNLHNLSKVNSLDIDMEAS